MNLFIRSKIKGHNFLSVLALVLLGLMFCVGGVSAQTTNAAAAKDAYFKAQALYESGQYEDALAKLDDAERLRGTTDVYFQSLRVRIDLKRRYYAGANEGLMKIDKSRLGLELSKEVSRLRRQVDAGLTQQLHEWSQSCDKGNAFDCLFMGYSYHFEKYGRAAQDPIIASEYYERACEGNEAGGCFFAGTLYTAGKGITQDHFTARKFYRKACDMRYRTGCDFLAASMVEGMGGPVDTKSAEPLLLNGCEANSNVACYYLGFIYRFGGKGLPQNPNKSLVYFQKSCDLGHEVGCADLAEISK
ncbi:MAG: tetratricopeptide repeat protein [Litorimonas sp.]